METLFIVFVILSLLVIFLGWLLFSWELYALLISAISAILGIVFIYSGTTKNVWLGIFLITFSALMFYFCLAKYYDTYIRQPRKMNVDLLISRLIQDGLGSFYIYRLLTNLKSSNDINLFCQAWSKSRHKKLTKILVKSNYIATQPGNLRVLSALKTNKLKDCLHQEPKLIKFVLDCFEDQDPEISSRARKYALELKDQSVIDALLSQHAS